MSLSKSAAEILTVLHVGELPMTTFQIWIRSGKSQEDVAGCLEELRVARLAEPRPRVSPPHWQIVTA